MFYGGLTTEQLLINSEWCYDDGIKYHADKFG
jgi:hypothetical protein